jgi:lathosterol oxidase
MDDLLTRRFPGFVELTAGTTVDLVIRYALLAGLGWVLCYVLFKRRWLHRKVISRFPRWPEIRRELAYSLLSMVIFGLVGAGTVMASRHGWTHLYWQIGQHGWGWFWLSIVCVIFLHDAYFYWTHRMMHHRRLYKLFHRVHHLSTNPSPWASYAFSPLEAVVQASIFPLAAAVLPIHPLAFLIFMFWQITFNILGHTGYEFHPAGLMKSRLRWVLNTPTYHVLHHEKFQGNYGLYFNLWDWLMGTNHPDSEARFQEVTTRSPAERAENAPPAIIEHPYAK